jgi:toxin HigB-1
MVGASDSCLPGQADQKLRCRKASQSFSGFERSARLKLDRLEAATSIRDLAALPGNRFESVADGRKGQFSIRINDQWRVCFEWAAAAIGPHNVEIVDYH